MPQNLRTVATQFLKDSNRLIDNAVIWNDIYDSLFIVPERTFQRKLHTAQGFSASRGHIHQIYFRVCTCFF